jgi:hypothetical protein
VRRLTKAQERLLARIFHDVNLRRAEEAEAKADEVVAAEVADAKRRIPPARYSTKDDTNTH